MCAAALYCTNISVATKNKFLKLIILIILITKVIHVKVLEVQRRLENFPKTFGSASRNIKSSKI